MDKGIRFPKVQILDKGIWFPKVQILDKGIWFPKVQILDKGRRVSNGWGMFTQMLKYKLADQGKQLIKIDKWFPSSKTCSVCGVDKQELLLSERTYICDCGNAIDRDINAAINIKNEAIRILETA